LELLHHFNIASVLTDSHEYENLGFLSNKNNLVSNNWQWSDSLEETHLETLIGAIIFILKRNLRHGKKINRIMENTDTIFIYFDSQYGGKASVIRYDLKN
jgi:hypothetical protein